MQISITNSKFVRPTIRQEFPDADVAVRELDLTSLSSVKNFSDGIAKDYDRLDILINNAGIMRFLNTFFSQGIDMGALPTLRAAIDPDAESGDYFGPSKFFEMHGHPVKMRSNIRSYDEQAARHLWELSEKLTGIEYQE